MSDNPIIYDSELELRAAAAITSSANGTGKYVGPTTLIKAVVIVSAKSGTNPTLDIHFEESNDDSSYSDCAGAILDQITAVGVYEVYLKTAFKYLRAVWAVGGTNPSFTTQILLTTKDH